MAGQNNPEPWASASATDVQGDGAAHVLLMVEEVQAKIPHPRAGALPDGPIAGLAAGIPPRDVPPVAIGFWSNRQSGPRVIRGHLIS